MGLKTLAAGAALMLAVGSTAHALTAIWNNPQTRTRADTCSLLVSIARSPDPFNEKSAAAIRAKKEAVTLARRAHGAVCVKDKGEPEPQVAKDGSQHFGRMVDGKPEGLGVRFYADGSRYIGEWKAGLRQGEGMGLQSDGARYVGPWDLDKPHGQGAVQYHAKLKISVDTPKPGAPK